MKLVELGIITRTHGYKGDFVVKSYAGRDSALGSVATLYLGSSENSVTSHEIREAAWMPSGWKIGVSGVDSEEAAKLRRGQKVFADREALPKPAENEFYIADLLGAKVVDASSGQELGTFTGVEGEDGGTKWWAVKTLERTVLVPPKKHFIERVDAKNKVIFVRHWEDL